MEPAPAPAPAPAAEDAEYLFLTPDAHVYDIEHVYEDVPWDTAVPSPASTTFQLLFKGPT